MKKFLLTILTFVYLGVSSGLAREVHYCMGKIAGVEYFGGSDDDRCGRCGMEEDKTGCCHDEHSFHKLVIDQKLVSNDIQFDQPVFFLVSPIQSCVSIGLGAETVSADVTDHSPPVYSGIYRCILHGVFRL